MAERRPTDELLATFSRLLVGLRQQSGRTLREVAEEVFVTASYLSLLEKGSNPKTSRPSRPTQQLVLRLARALNANLDEALALARFAGYDLSSEGDKQAVAFVLNGGRIPAVFQDLPDLETDLESYVADNVIEAPIFTVLGHLDTDSDETSDVRIVGRSFRAWGEPASLYRIKATAGNLELEKQLAQLCAGEQIDGQLRIGVLGQLMTPTVLLLRHLARSLTPYRVINADRPDGSYSSPHAVDGEPCVEIHVVYSDQTLIDSLVRDWISIALAVHPFRRVRDAKDVFEPIELDLWIAYRNAELPMSLVVTSREMMSSEARREALVDRLDQLRHGNRGMIGTRRDHARKAIVALPTEDAQVPLEPEVTPELENYPELYLDERDKRELAADLATLSELGFMVGVLKSAKGEYKYLPHITTRTALLKGEFTDSERVLSRQNLEET